MIAFPFTRVFFTSSGTSIQSPPALEWKTCFSTPSLREKSESLFHTLPQWVFIPPFICPSICLYYVFILSVVCCLQALRKTGLHPSDPRLKDCMDKLRQAVRESVAEVMMDRELFHRWDSGGDGQVFRTESSNERATALVRQQTVIISQPVPFYFGIHKKNAAGFHPHTHCAAYFQ